MQISTKGRYALRFLLDLCQHQGTGPVPLKDIAQRQGISKKYLEQVIALLNPTGILQVTRGYQGGYRLAKAPRDITVADVLAVTESGFTAGAASTGTNVDTTERSASLLSSNETMLEPIWEGLEQTVNDYLAEISLQDIIDRYTPTIESFI